MTAQIGELRQCRMSFLRVEASKVYVQYEKVPHSVPSVSLGSPPSSTGSEDDMHQTYPLSTHQSTPSITRRPFGASITYLHPPLEASKHP